MHRPGMDPNNVQMTDILCDFCLSPWNEKSIFIEGHQGSVICGKCLAIAYAEVVNQQQNSAPAGYKCTMCLEHREDKAWQSPMTGSGGGNSDDDETAATICQRCIELAAEAIDKDADSDWSPPKP